MVHGRFQRGRRARRFTPTWTRLTPAAAELHVICQPDPVVDLLRHRRPDGHQSATRDWTVTASTFATLNDNWQLRANATPRPSTVNRVTAELRDLSPRGSQLMNGGAADWRRQHLRLTWNPQSRLTSTLRRTGPKHCDQQRSRRRFILPPTAAVEWSISRAMSVAVAAIPLRSDCVTSPAYIGDNIAHQTRTMLDGLVACSAPPSTQRRRSDGVQRRSNAH